MVQSVPIALQGENLHPLDRLIRLYVALGEDVVGQDVGIISPAIRVVQELVHVDVLIFVRVIIIYFVENELPQVLQRPKLCRSVEKIKLQECQPSNVKDGPRRYIHQLIRMNFELLAGLQVLLLEGLCQ